MSSELNELEKQELAKMVLSLKDEPLKSGANMTLEEKNKRLLLVTDILKVISQPTRLSIVCTLEDSCLSVGEIMQKLPGVSQPMISQHLGVLKLNGIVKDEKRGQFVYYCLKNEKVQKLIGSMREIFCS